MERWWLSSYLYIHFSCNREYPLLEVNLWMKVFCHHLSNFNFPWNDEATWTTVLHQILHKVWWNPFRRFIRLLTTSMIKCKFCHVGSLCHHLRTYEVMEMCTSSSIGRSIDFTFQPKGFIALPNRNIWFDVHKSGKTSKLHEGIRAGSVLYILNKGLILRRMLSKYMPKQLASKYKQLYLEVSLNMLSFIDGNPDFLITIIIDYS